MPVTANLACIATHQLYVASFQIDGVEELTVARHGYAAKPGAMPKRKAKPLLERKTRAMPQRPHMATVGIILVGLGHDRMLQNNELILDVMTLGDWQVRVAKQTNKQIKQI